MTKLPLTKEELASQFSYSWASLLQDVGEIYAMTDFTIETAQEMLRDETIYSGLHFFSVNVGNAIGEYAHDNPEIQEFVQENFENLDRSFELVISDMVMKTKTYGFCAAELVWEPRGTKLYLKRIVPLEPLRTTFKLESGNLAAVVQYAARGRVEIPVEKTFILRNSPELYGKSALEPVYRAWKMKKVLFKFWAIAMERYAVPVLYGKTSGDTDALAQALGSLWSRGVIAASPDVEIQVLEPKSSVAETFAKAIEQLDLLIYRGLLLPRLLGGPTTVGSYALGKVHMDLFLSSVRREARLVAEEVIDQIVAKIIDYNFADINSYGRFLESGDMSIDDKQKLAATLVSLAQAGIIDPVQDEEWIRSMLNFPVPETGEESGEKEEAWEITQQALKEFAEGLTHESGGGSESAG